MQQNTRGWKSDIVQDAKGKWGHVLACCGVNPKHLDGKHGACPMCGGKDRFRYDNRTGRGDYICAKCGVGDGFNLLMKLFNWDFSQASEEVKKYVGGTAVIPPKSGITPEAKQAALRTLWGDTARVKQGDAVDDYLRQRGLSLTEFPKDLRTCPKARADAINSFPAMIALVRDVEGKPTTLHRTFLSQARKAEISAPRRLMPGEIPAGSAIRLAPYEKILGIAEGIETALSAMQLFKIPVWAALNAVMLEKWLPPAGVTEVIIFADKDESYTGQKAAYTLAFKLKNLNIEKVSVVIPDVMGQDWNDYLQWKKKHEPEAVGV